MNRLNELYQRYFSPKQPIPPGMYQYQSPKDAAAPYRLHLRIEADGQGILIINASTVLHLNRTAAEIAYYVVQQTPEREAVSQLVQRYRVSREQAQQDYIDMKARIDMLATTQDLDPVTYLGVERTTPFSGELSAPYRIDCALTYQTTSDEQNVAPRERVRRELTTEEWQTVLKKAWDAGIPHVIFTGGEPTLRPDLVELIGYVEQLGMVAGLLTDGSRLTEKDYIHHLLQSGLDHMTILLDDHEEQNWEALRDVLGEDIFVTVHLTLTAANQHSRVQVLERLKEMGVGAVSLSASDPDLKDALKELGNAAAERDLQLVWNIPVPYSGFHPVAVELAEVGELPEGAGKAWLYVEPDGDVLATQGRPEVLGNLLTESWEQIWRKP